MSLDPAATDLGCAGFQPVARDQGTAEGIGTRDIDISRGTEALSLDRRTKLREREVLDQEKKQEQGSERPDPTLIDVGDAVATGEGEVEAGIPLEALVLAPIILVLDGSIERGEADPSSAIAVTQAQIRHTAPIPIPPPQMREGITQDPQPFAETYLPAANESTGPPLPQPPTNGTNGHAGKAMFGSNAASSAHRRRVMATTNALTKYEADLTDQDRAKQKDAVRRHLAERVKSDWEWQWPRSKDPISRPGSPSSDPADLTNASEAVEEQWKERDEWQSNTSDGEDPEPPAAEPRARQSSGAQDDAFCFGSPESVGGAIRKHEMDRKRRRKKRLAEEMAYNDGMRCFVQRRDSWTGARQAIPPSDNGLGRSRTKRSSIYSLLSGMSPPPADGEPESDKALGRARTKRSSVYSMLSARAAVPTGAEPEAESELDVATEVPIVAPILPPENAMRASITPAAYNTIYEKVILQQLTPSCPMNLKDVTRSCVQGWKRDGEWPPKSTEPVRRKSRRLSFVSLFSFEKNDDRDRAKEKEPERGNEKADDHAEGHDKTLKRPAATLGKGIRKIMFWKEKQEGVKDGPGKGGNGPAEGT